jgi:AraC-like DNA-binding protein
VKYGKITVQVKSAVSYLGKDEGIFINSNCMHMLKPYENEACAIMTFFVHPKLFSAFPGSVVERKYVKPFVENDEFASMPLIGNVPWQSIVLERLKRIYDISSSQYKGYELDVMLEYMMIWKSMIASIPMGKVGMDIGAGNDSHRMKTILTYIHEHYADKITLEELATKINLSRNECSRFFRRSTNCSLFDYILNYRISKGSELLRSGDKSVKQAAYEVGFRDVSYFITSFKKRTGYTPKEYQRKMLASA